MTDKKPIKIIHLVKSLKLGKIGRFIEFVGYNFNQTQFDLEIWCLKEEGEVAERLKRKSITIKLFELGDSCYQKESIEHLTAMLKQSNVDILHTHCYFTNTLGRYAAIKAKTPVIISHLHDEPWDHTIRQVFHEWWLSHFTDTIICASQSLKKFAQKYEKISDKKLQTIYSGIDIKAFDKDEAFRPISKSYGLTDDDKVIVCVAPLTAHQGHQYLIESMPAIVQQNPHVKCLLIGDGNQKQYLKELIESKNLTQNILFMGIRDDVPFFLQHADLFVLPSLSEGFPISLLEAMLACLPIVATSVGGIPEMITNGVNGLLVPPKNPEALTLAIVHLLDNNAKRSKFAHHGRILVEENFTFQQTLKQIEKLYIDLYRKKQ